MTNIYSGAGLIVPFVYSSIYLLTVGQISRERMVFFFLSCPVYFIVRVFGIFAVRSVTNRNTEREKRIVLSWQKKELNAYARQRTRPDRKREREHRRPRIRFLRSFVRSLFSSNHKMLRTKRKRNQE